jgi:hypothetical protein
MVPRCLQGVSWLMSLSWSNSCCGASFWKKKNRYHATVYNYLSFHECPDLTSVPLSFAHTGQSHWPPCFEIVRSSLA